jgi:hypothetical protein
MVTRFQSAIETRPPPATTSMFEMLMSQLQRVVCSAKVLSSGKSHGITVSRLEHTA